MTLYDRIRFTGVDKLGNTVEGSLVLHPLGRAYIIQYKHTTPMWIEVDINTVKQL